MSRNKSNDTKLNLENLLVVGKRLPKVGNEGVTCFERENDTFLFGFPRFRAMWFDSCVRTKSYKSKRKCKSLNQQIFVAFLSTSVWDGGKSLPKMCPCSVLLFQDANFGAILPTGPRFSRLPLVMESHSLVEIICLHGGKNVENIWQFQQNILLLTFWIFFSVRMQIPEQMK